MTDIGLVLRKLQYLGDQIALVRARRPASPDQLASDLLLRDALALALMVALQQVIDVSYHIAADEGWGVPDSHRAAYELLAARGVITVELAGRLSGITALRNRIAHGYATVEHARIWQELPEGLQTLEEFRAAVATWLPDP